MIAVGGPVAGGVAVLLAAGGAALIYSDTVVRPSGHGQRRRLRELVATGLPGPAVGRAPSRQIVYASVLAAAGGATLAYILFGGAVPILAGAAFAATFPAAAYRRRCRLRMESDAEAWPRLVEEIRLRTGSLGRSIPQALFEAGRHAPDDWRPAFVAAEREWLLTTDFTRTTSMLKEALASPPGDVVLETLLMAYDVGGVDLDSWLAGLAEDRQSDVESRKDAVSRQSGVRFARSFVLLVPLGMTLAGLGIGSGRSAYETPGGQLAVLVGILATAGCWVWSGRLMLIPDPPRVFGPRPAGAGPGGGPGLRHLPSGDGAGAADPPGPPGPPRATGGARAGQPGVTP